MSPCTTRLAATILCILCTLIRVWGQTGHDDNIRYVHIDSASIFLRIVGSGDPLVIVHGGPGMSHDYLATPFINLLSKDYQLIFYDQRASGRSSGAEDTNRLTLPHFVRDLEALRQELNIQRLNILGHSFGGLLTMYYAIAYPKNVNKILLVDSSPASWELNFPGFRKTIAERQTPMDKEALQAIEQTENYRMNPDLMERYLRIFFRVFFKNPSLSNDLELGINEGWLRNFTITGNYIWRNLDRYDIHDNLSRISAPTLIMYGEKSVFSMAGSKEIHKHIPHSKMVIMKNVGHFPFMEDPKSFNRTIKSFLKDKRTSNNH